MSTSSYNYNQPYAPPPPPQSSGGGCLKWLGCGCLIVILLCCGLGGAIGWWGYSTVQNSVSDDPADVETLRRDACDIEIPDEFKPQGRLLLNVDLIKLQVRGFAYASENPRQALIYFDISPLGEELAFEEGFRTQFTQDGKDESITWGPSQQAPVEIRGEELSATQRRGKDKQGREVLQTTVVFKAANGNVASIILITDPTKYDEQESIEIIETIK